MTGPSGNRLSICPLRFRIARAQPRSIRTLGEAILNLSGQIDLPITLETSHYLFTASILISDEHTNLIITSYPLPKLRVCTVVNGEKFLSHA